MHEELKIAGHKIERGTTLQIKAKIARLPSHTEIDIPIIVHRSLNDGPVLLLMAGMHGDEINGMEIVRRCIRDEYNLVDRGTTICIPILNIFGFINFSRAVPDGKDVNRSFPGNKTGSLASRVAYYIMKEVIPFIDYGVDFHTGGAARTNYPQIRCLVNDPVNKELSAAFYAPFTLHSVYRPKSLRFSAGKLGKRIIVYEGGESSRLDEDAIQEGVNGTLRLMKHLGMREDAPKPEFENKVLVRSSWIRARNAGLFRPRVVSGDWIKKNQVVGTLTDPFGEFRVEIKAPVGGYIVGLNYNPVVNMGDALMHIGLENGKISEQPSEGFE